jgi:predicted extracellular nuclease
LASVSVSAQKEYSIAEIQGDKNLSPLVDSAVRVTGVVTARTRTGFFIQTPDEKADSDPKTSEGLFVFTKTEPPVEASIGNMVSALGKVEEFRPRAEPFSLPITELVLQGDRDNLKVLSAGNPLPKPVAITADDFNTNTLDQIERFEGMR